MVSIGTPVVPEIKWTNPVGLDRSQGGGDDRGPGSGGIDQSPGGSGAGASGSTPDSGSAEEITRELEALEANPPKPGDYPPNLRFEYGVALANHHERLGELRRALLEAYQAGASETSPTSAALFAAGEAADVPIVVLSDATYAARFPGTGGVTSNGVIYLPQRALTSDSGVLEHELLHALLQGDMFDPALSQEARIAAAEELFTSIGLAPEDGVRLVTTTEGWPEGTAEHLQAFVIAIDKQREQAGLPPLSESERDALYTQAGLREAALGALRTEFDVEGEDAPFSLSMQPDANGNGEPFLEAIEALTPEQQQALYGQMTAKWSQYEQLEDRIPDSGTPLERLQEMYHTAQALDNEGALVERFGS